MPICLIIHTQSLMLLLLTSSVGALSLLLWSYSCLVELAGSAYVPVVVDPALRSLVGMYTFTLEEAGRRREREEGRA